MGRSTPTHIRKECNLGEYGMDDASSDLDLTDEASIRAFAQVFKKRRAASTMRRITISLSIQEPVSLLKILSESVFSLGGRRYLFLAAHMAPLSSGRIRPFSLTMCTSWSLMEALFHFLMFMRIQKIEQGKRIRGSTTSCQVVSSLKVLVA